MAEKTPRVATIAHISHKHALAAAVATIIEQQRNPPMTKPSREDFEVVADEIGWLIESEWDRPMWLSLSKSVPGYWTPDSLKATRFARRVDAEDWLASQEVIDPAKVTITEHIWSGDHSSAKPASPTPDTAHA